MKTPPLCFLAVSLALQASCHVFSRFVEPARDMTTRESIFLRDHGFLPY
jgi:hypothetical protein